jgi:hypothetical protein
MGAHYSIRERAIERARALLAASADLGLSVVERFDVYGNTGGHLAAWVEGEGGQATTVGLSPREVVEEVVRLLVRVEVSPPLGDDLAGPVAGDMLADMQVALMGSEAARRLVDDAAGHVGEALTRGVGWSGFDELVEYDDDGAATYSVQARFDVPVRFYADDPTEGPGVTKRTKS